MKKSDLERLKKIIENWSKLKQQMQDHHIDRDTLLHNEFFQWAVTTPLYNIGEQVYQLSDDTKAMDPSQPWKAIAGLRHRLVHDYEGTNWEIIAEVLFNDMDPFVEAVERLADRLQQDTFDA